MNWQLLTALCIMVYIMATPALTGKHYPQIWVL